jgi:3-deoxy-D-manno-octulosonate 8-phosphate phosphatase (KDO 8-P phosphatase)
MDVDGVLTDGGVYVLDDGREFRRFSIKDGLGLKQVMSAGIRVIWISASKCQSIHHRAHGLGIMDVHLGVKDKQALLEKMCHEMEIPLDRVAYIGDDMTDLDVLKHVGLPCSPADAVEVVKRQAVYVTQVPGGNGAVREICDLLVNSSLR